MFNRIRDSFVLAPFWDEIDLRKAGNVFYEVHTTFNNDSDSLMLLSEVNEYIEWETADIFLGSWMLLVQWDDVHSYPHGKDVISSSDEFFYPHYMEVSQRGKLIQRYW